MIADPFLFLLDSIAQHFARALSKDTVPSSRIHTLNHCRMSRVGTRRCNRVIYRATCTHCGRDTMDSPTNPPLPLLSLSSTWKILISPEGGYERERERENERQDEQTMTTVDWDSNRELERHAVFFPPFWVSTTFTIPQRHMFSRNWWPQSWKG